MTSARIVVFAKAPVPGTVKTRLAGRFGDAGAASIHVELVERTLAVATSAGAALVELCCAPDPSHGFFAACARRFGVMLEGQGKGDLGARMHRALARGVATGAPVVLVGTDCPVMSADYLGDAIDRLARGARCVLGPAEDGGYVLVGARERVEPAMFDGIAWGTGAVLASTRERLRTAGIPWEELPTLWDVDHPADVARWRQSEADAQGREDLRAGDAVGGRG